MTDPTTIPPAKPSWVPDPRAVIVYWMMISTFSIIMTILIRGVPTGPGTELLNTLLGMYVGTGFITALNWWCSSSKGSEDKTNIMAGKP